MSDLDLELDEVKGILTVKGNISKPHQANALVEKCLSYNNEYPGRTLELYLSSETIGSAFLNALSKLQNEKNKRDFNYYIKCQHKETKNTLCLFGYDRTIDIKCNV